MAVFIGRPRTASVVASSRLTSPYHCDAGDNDKIVTPNGTTRNHPSQQLERTVSDRPRTASVVVASSRERSPHLGGDVIVAAADGTIPSQQQERPSSGAAFLAWRSDTPFMSSLRQLRDYRYERACGRPRQLGPTVANNAGIIDPPSVVANANKQQQSDRQQQQIVGGDKVGGVVETCSAERNIAPQRAKSAGPCQRLSVNDPNATMFRSSTIAASHGGVVGTDDRMLSPTVVRADSADGICREPPSVVVDDAIKNVRTVSGIDRGRRSATAQRLSGIRSRPVTAHPSSGIRSHQINITPPNADAICRPSHQLDEAEEQPLSTTKPPGEQRSARLPGHNTAMVRNLYRSKEGGIATGDDDVVAPMTVYSMGLSDLGRQQEFRGRGGHKHLMRQVAGRGVTSLMYNRGRGPSKAVVGLHHRPQAAALGGHTLCHWQAQSVDVRPRLPPARCYVISPEWLSEDDAGSNSRNRSVCRYASSAAAAQKSVQETHTFCRPKSTIGRFATLC